MDGKHVYKVLYGKFLCRGEHRLHGILVVWARSPRDVFYDILVAVAEKFQFDYPDDKNIELAKEIRAALRDKEKYSDWANSMQIKALMQADIIMILAKHGYPPVPPEIYEKVYNDILEQAENFKKYSDD